MSLYFFLALMALIFTCFGAVLHAFYFPRSHAKTRSRVRDRHFDQMDKGQPDLVEAQMEISRLSARIRSLEHEIQLKKEELNTVKSSPLQPEVEIKQLPQDVGREESTGMPPKSVKSRRSGNNGPAADSKKPGRSAGAGRRSKKTAARVDAHTKNQPDEEPLKLTAADPPSPGDLKPESEGSAGGESSPGQELQKSSDATPWKENLNSVLTTLDRMEKEIKK